MSMLTRRSALALVVAFGAFAYFARPKGEAAARKLYAKPLPKPQGALSVYHLGHSLVGRDMPAMLAQLAGPDHQFHSQLGWGTSLREHWEPEQPINGFEAENDHPNHLPAHDAIGSGSYDAVILTEMVEIRDAIRYHDSADYLARWADLAQQANPKARIYLYETWHHRDDAQGWLARIDDDLSTYWQGQIAFPALARSDAPIHLIPAGQVLAAFLRAVEARGGVAGIAGSDDLFARTDDGLPDTIHFNDLGAYLVALTHFSVLYHRSPVGLPFQLNRADGSPATAATPEAALLMQETVWEVISRHAETGVAA